MDCIYETIKNIVDSEDYTRFHMPGHKGRSKFKLDWFKYDVTEIPGTDNLCNPKALLKDVQRKISEIFEVKESFVLVNGSTVGILAALMAICNSGETFIIPRNSHKSVYSAVMIHHIRPEYVYYDRSDSHLYIDYRDVEKAFKKYPNSKGIVVTTPTYYGTCSNIKKISEVARKYDKILVVDEAHGAHLKFNEKYPESSVDLGADVVIQSTHKTLNSLNQGGLLHICSDRVDIDKVRMYLNMLQTSSPSYPIMMSVENAVVDANVNGKAKLEEILDYYEYISVQLRDTGYSLINDTTLQNCSYDRSKLWITSEEVNCRELFRTLREDYNIQLEMNDLGSVLGMMGMGTEKRDIVNLVRALKRVESTLSKNTNTHRAYNPYPIAEKVFQPWDVLGLPSELRPLNVCVGRVSSDFIIPYPPGVPLVVPGERIDNCVVELIRSFDGTEIVGLTEDMKISVIR